MSEKDELQIKVNEETARGVYANAMQVSHTKEEFVLDFINLLPPQGQVTARIITSPGHLKRIIAALGENLARYEKQFGQVEASANPPPVNIKPN